MRNLPKSGTRLNGSPGDLNRWNQDIERYGGLCALAGKAFGRKVLHIAGERKTCGGVDDPEWVDGVKEVLLLRSTDIAKGGFRLTQENLKHHMTSFQSISCICPMEAAQHEN